MLTEQQVRESFEKVLGESANLILTTDPLDPICFWLHMTQEEIEAQLNLLKQPPTNENQQIFLQTQNLAMQKAAAAVERGEIPRPDWM